MRIYAIRRDQAGPEGHTHCAVIGTAADQAGTTDFSAAASTQSYTLYTLKAGDSIQPGMLVDIVTPLAGAGATYKFQVGISGGTANQFVGAASNGDDLKSTTAKAYVGTITSAPDQTAHYVNTSGSDQTVVGVITAASGNVSALTAGQIKVWFRVSRRASRDTAQV
jgi:hypothetical protein